MKQELHVLEVHVHLAMQLVNTHMCTVHVFEANV